MFDGVDGLSLEQLFDNTEFYNEVTLGITKETFETVKSLRVFVPVTTFN